MTDRTIYVEQHSTGDTAMYRVDVENLTNDRVVYRIGPSDLDIQWTELAIGNIDIHLKDDGNGIRLITEPATKGEHRQTLDLNYSQLSELIILLDAWKRGQDIQVNLSRFKQLEDDE